MTLLLPLALLGLLTLPAILLLHLLRNRREQLTIPSLRLWQGLQQEKHGGQPRHIPLSVMLLLQLLAATAITLALARPAFSFVLNRPAHTTFILDMSTSMTALDGSPDSRFEQARREIERHIQSLAEADSVAVVGLSAQPQVLLNGTGAQKGTLLLALDNLVPGAVGIDLSQALSLANGLIEPDLRNQIIVLTDGAFDADPARLPTVQAPLEWQFIPDSLGDVSNQALLNVSAMRLPDGRHRIFARAVNYGDAVVDRTLRVFAGNSVAAETRLTLQPQADAVRIWTLPAQAETAAVELVEPDLLPADNRADLFLGSLTRVRVLLVSNSPETLARVFEAQAGVEVTLAEPEALPANLNEYDLLAFDRLPLTLETWPQGSVLAINPPLGHPLLPADQLTRDLRPDPLTASPLLAGLELSGVFVGRAPHIGLPAWATIDLQGRSSRAEETLVPLIFHGSPRSGSQVMVWAFDLDSSNLPGRVAFPLLVANTLSTLLAPSPPPVAAVGQPVTIPGSFSVETPDGHRLFAESDRQQNLFGRTRQIGLYKIYNSSSEVVAGFAVHAGSAQESNLQQRLTPATVAAIAVDPAAAPAPDIDFEEYWPWLVGLALAVVMAEGWLAWRK